MKRKSYTYERNWWDIIQGLDTDTRDEITIAINRYVFDGEESELTERAARIYKPISQQLKKKLKKADEISAKRSKAGKKGGAPAGNQNALKQAKTSKNKQMLEFDAQDAEIEEVMSEQAKQANACISSPPTPPSIIYIPPPPQNAHDAREGTREEVRAWILSNPHLDLLLYNCKIVSGPKEAGELREATLPYIDEYFDGELVNGTDFYTKGRADTIRHFAAWLRIQTRIKQNQNEQQPTTTTTSRPGGAGAGKIQYGNAWEQVAQQINGGRDLL